MHAAYPMATSRRIGQSVKAMAFPALGAACLFVVLTVLTIWTESQRPRDAEPNLKCIPPASASEPSEKQAFPINRQEDKRAFRARLDQQLLYNGLSLEETISRFLDERIDLRRRLVYGYRLARAGNPEAVAALLKVFRSAPPEQKAFLAQLVGSTCSPSVKEWLSPLLNDPDQEIVKAAIVGLSAIGGDDVAAALAWILSDPQRPAAVRIAAAAGLGDFGTPAARDALIEAFEQFPGNDGSAEQLLKSLGKFPYPTIAETLGEFFSAPDLPAEMRVAAAEALANSSQEAVPFLLALARDDGDANVRAAAAWAVSMHPESNDLGPSLAAMVSSETEADVRRRIYEALLPQQEIPGGTLLPAVLAEQDTAARIAGFNALSRAVAQAPSSATAATFNEQIVPELQRFAASPDATLNLRLRAIFALRRAQTPAAQDALTILANDSIPQISQAARQGLRTTN